MPKFTLIGATTKAGELSGPLRDRFGIIHRLEFYTNKELAQVIKRTAGILDIEIDEDGAFAIAKRSRGTPRIANRLIKRVSDYALVKYNGKITKDIANESLDILKIDEFGLDTTDRNLLKLIIENMMAGLSVLRPLLLPLGKMQEQLRMFANRFCCKQDYCKEHRADVRFLLKHTGIWGIKPNIVIQSNKICFS